MIDPPQPAYLTRHEAEVLVVALARSLDPDCQPADATEASRIVWQSPVATPVQRSLATMLAEITY